VNDKSAPPTGEVAALIEYLQDAKIWKPGGLYSNTRDICDLLARLSALQPAKETK